jgi:predicted ABC-type ATPase
VALQSIKSLKHEPNLKKIIIISGPKGGHNIPEEVIRRRFKAGLDNFHERYSKVVDSWAFYDSSGMHPKLIDWSNK